MPPRQEDDAGALWKAREQLYKLDDFQRERPPLAEQNERELPHEWGNDSHKYVPVNRGKRRVRLAGIFFILAFIFFIISLGVAGYFFYFGGNSVSVDKVTVDIQGPTTIAAGDTVPLSLSIVNKNPVAIDNAIIEIGFPTGTRKADGTLNAYPRYTENLGTLASGAAITRSIKAIVFGGAGQALVLPISISYKTTGSNTAFVKKSSYALAVSSTPLSVSVDAPSETVSGKPFIITLTVRSNAAVPLDNVVLTGTLPFGFSATSFSIPFSDSNFFIGTMSPGDSKTITLTGTLLGQENEQRVFHFTVGTSKTENDKTITVAYMTQDASVAITSPFITANISLSGNAGADVVVSPESYQNAAISYSNTLPTSVANAVIEVAISGSAVDYGSIQTANGFYRSDDHTVVFSKDTDPSLSQLAPGASGLGSFTFSTLPTSASRTAPSITFTISVSGTRVGQTNVPEQISASFVKTVKVATSVLFSASSLHSSGPFAGSGPIPPRANQDTTYAVIWNARNDGSTVADGKVSAVLPVYVSYTGATAGSGSFSYDEGSRTVLWDIGDLSQNRSIQGAFQVSLKPSTSQKGEAPILAGTASFSGYDRFAGVQISATANPVTTETSGDPGYVPANAVVQ